MSKNLPNQISLWLTDQELNFIDRVSQDQMMSRAGWLRRLIVQEMRKDGAK